MLSSFAVPRGPVDLRFLVREKASGRAGSLRVQLEVPAFEAGRIVLSPALAMDDPHARLVLPAASRGLPGLEIPFRLAETPFTADPLPILRNGAPREFCVIAWSGEARYGRGEPYTVEAELVDDAGVARALALVGAPRVVQDADGLERYVVGVAAKGVASGRYGLRLLFRDPATGATIARRASGDSGRESGCRMCWARARPDFSSESSAGRPVESPPAPWRTWCWSTRFPQSADPIEVLASSMRATVAWTVVNGRVVVREGQLLGADSRRCWPRPPRSVAPWHERRSAAAPRAGAPPARAAPRGWQDHRLPLDSTGKEMVLPD